MPRMSKKRKHELSFYLNDRGRVTYNELCRKCQHGCRQSFRAVVIDCPRYLSKRSNLADFTYAFIYQYFFTHDNNSFSHFYRYYAVCGSALF